MEETFIMLPGFAVITFKVILNLFYFYINVYKKQKKASSAESILIMLYICSKEHMMIFRLKLDIYIYHILSRLGVIKHQVLKSIKH